MCPHFGLEQGSVNCNYNIAALIALQPTRLRFVLRALGSRRLLRRTDYISAPLSGSKVPNETRSGWNHGEGGVGVPTKQMQMRSVAVGLTMPFILKH